MPQAVRRRRLHKLHVNKLCTCFFIINIIPHGGHVHQRVGPPTLGLESIEFHPVQFAHRTTPCEIGGGANDLARGQNFIRVVSGVPIPELRWNRIRCTNAN